MSLRINNNSEALNGYRQVSKNNAMLATSLQRLSSGLRINKASDDAAGLVISEQMRAQITGLNQAISNSETAVNMVQTAEGALDEMNTLLKKVRSLALHAANAAPNDVSQLTADQSELDNAISSISRIAQTTQFGTKKLLDGTLAATNSYDTTKVHSFDVGGALLTRTDFAAGRVSLVIDTSGESKTYLKTGGALTSTAGETLANTTSGVGVTASTVSVQSLSAAISSAIGGAAGSWLGSITFGTAFGAASLTDTANNSAALVQSFGGFFANGANVVGGGSFSAVALDATDGRTVRAGTVYGSMVIRVGETTFGFTDGVSVSTIMASLNAGQDKYSITYAASANGGLEMYTKSTGNVAAVRDFSVQAFYSMNVVVASAAGDASAISIQYQGSATFANTTQANASFGHNLATAIHMNGAGTFTGITLGTSITEDTSGVFVMADGTAPANTIREALGNATNALKAGASATITVAGKDYQFSNAESMGDMVSYINSKQTDYTLQVDRDNGLSAVRNKLGDGGAVTDINVRLTDVTGTTVSMTPLSDTTVGFEGTSPTASGIDRGVNLRGRLIGDGLPGGTINLNSTGEDASLLKNSAYGITIDATNDFLKSANDTVNNTVDAITANITKGAMFQVGPNNAQLVAVDLKDMQSTKLGLGGDTTETLRNLQDLVGKQALVNGYSAQALDVIDQAIDDVTVLRGALGAFQANALETGLNSLRTSHENLSSAESTIRDTDFASESSVFAKNQILVQASTAMLAQANQLPQNVLQLLGR